MIVDPELPVLCWRDQGQVHQGHLETQAVEADLAGRTLVGCEAQPQEFLSLPQAADAIRQVGIQGAVQELHVASQGPVAMQAISQVLACVLGIIIHQFANECIRFQDGGGHNPSGNTSI